MARRADRRLRETASEARAIAVAAAESSNGAEAWTDHLCLMIKAVGAERAGTLALGRLTGPRAERLRPLAERIHRHALLADASLERLATELGRGEARRASVAPSTIESPMKSGARSHKGTPCALVAAAAFLLLGILTLPIWFGRPGATQPAGEGILAGVGPSRGDGGDAVPPPATNPGDDPSSAGAAIYSPSASPATLFFDFDAVRMGGGIGEGWVQANGTDEAVAVAAYPTAVDRSARLVVTGGVNPETCLLLEAPLAQLHRLGVEVILDQQMPATATIELRDAGRDPLLTLNLAESRAALTIKGGEIVTEGGGIEPGHWYGIEVTKEGVGVWRVLPLDDPSASGVEMSFELPPLAPVGEICLSANGPLGAAANYDKLAITNE